MALDLTNILKQKVEDIERPPLLPPGTYTMRVAKPAARREINDDWEALDFQLQPVEADMDTVDEDELKEFGDITKAQMRHTFMFDRNDATSAQRTAFNLRRFLEEHLQVVDAGADMSEAINAAHNATCMVTVVHKQDKQNPDLWHANVSATAPVA